ncbi:MAG: transporter substrate-binding domain-containing protein [Synergistaceae bacterium]|jgi:ABC-type amino acid transport substrate-binding protein|nr:transporter substrate-binding domain-containing protein [Synergistaceae bacterium]
MKNNLRKVLAALILTGVFWAGSSNNGTGVEAEEQTKTTARTIIVGSPEGVRPMSYTDEDGKFTGYEVEVLRKIAESLPKYDFEFRPMESKSIYAGMSNGKVDMSAANSRRSEGREAEFIHTKYAYNYSPLRFVVAEDNAEITSIKDLEGKKVAMTEGSLQAVVLADYIEKNGSAMELVYSSDYAQLLATGRVDAAVSPEWRIPAINASFDKFKIKPVGEVVEGTDEYSSDSNVYFWFAKDETELKDAIDAEILKLRKDGTLSKLAVEWLGTDFVSQIDTSKER